MEEYYYGLTPPRSQNRQTTPNDYSFMQLLPQDHRTKRGAHQRASPHVHAAQRPRFGYEIDWCTVLAVLLAIALGGTALGFGIASHVANGDLDTRIKLLETDIGLNAIGHNSTKTTLHEAVQELKRNLATLASDVANNANTLTQFGSGSSGA